MPFTGNIYGMQDNELRLEKEVFLWISAAYLFLFLVYYK